MVELVKKYKNYILIGIAILCAGLVYIWIPDGKTDTVTANPTINSANKADLQQVPGIGESKATAIIEYREKEGLFQTIEDLKNVSGIGEKTVEKLKEYLDVN
ncbi:ComEA family DNA-binding protein [Listeria monocytogenes]